MRARWPLFTGLLLTLALLWPLVVAPYFSHDDNVQTMRIYEMHQCFRDLQIPCRWVPDLGGGYGYPEFDYYAPLPYYVGELFYLTTQDIIVAAKLTFAAGFMLPLLSTYVVASMLWGKLGGSLSAIFFIFTPYHALNMYHRGAMGELWAMGVLPLVFWAFLALRNKPNRWSSLILGAALSLLIVSHNLTAMLVIAILGVLGAMQLWSRRQFVYAKHLILAGVWALMLSAFYLLPMLLESGFVHLETLTRNEYNYAEHFVSLRDLLIERPWWLPGNASEVSYQVGTIHVLAWGLSLVAAYRWRNNKQLRLIVVACSALIVACIFMINPASAWIWDRIGVLGFLQFPWRLLSLISFATSILAGACLLLVRNRQGRVLVWSALVASVVAMNVGWFRPDRFLNVNQTQLLSDGGWDNLKMFAIWDFLPMSARVAPSQPAPALYEVLSGESQVTAVGSGSNWVKFIAYDTTAVTIQIDKYDFPTWAVMVDGQVSPYDHDSSTGLINLSVPPGAHMVEARLRDTPLRLGSDIVSAGALMACAVMCLGSLLLKQQRLTLPRKRMAPAGYAGGGE